MDRKYAYISDSHVQICMQGGELFNGQFLKIKNMLADPSRPSKYKISMGVISMGALYRGDNFRPRMPCQWYVRGGGEGKQRIVIGQSVPPTPFGMAFGRLKLSPQYVHVRDHIMLSCTARVFSLICKPPTNFGQGLCA
jgi:hypothetical protein